MNNEVSWPILDKHNLHIVLAIFHGYIIMYDVDHHVDNATTCA